MHFLLASFLILFFFYLFRNIQHQNDTQGGYAGEAAGFKMMSLLKLPEIRANKPGINLIHFIAHEAEKSDGNLSSFAQDLPHLEEASK